MFVDSGQGHSSSVVARGPGARGHTETTVKGYVSEVLAKHNVRDRTQLVVLAYESGLVRPGEPPSA